MGALRVADGSCDLDCLADGALRCGGPLVPQNIPAAVARGEVRPAVCLGQGRALGEGSAQERVGLVGQRNGSVIALARRDGGEAGGCKCPQNGELQRKANGV